MKSKSRHQYNIIQLLVFFFIMTFIPCITTQTYNKCLVDRTEINPKKFLYFEGKSWNITLETYGIISHQLSTHVFRIFLQEVLGYSEVEIIKKEGTLNIEDVIYRLPDPFEELLPVPETMINVEVWVPPENDTVLILIVNDVKECGTVAPPVRFGWFIPITNNRLLSFVDESVDWTIFKDPKIVSNYEINDPNDMTIITTNSFNDQDYFCTDRICNRGMYVPAQCAPSKHQDVSCALLLAPDYNLTKFVIDQIKEFGLFVKVVWLGPNLKNVVDQLKHNYKRGNSNQKFVVMSWTQSEVILNGDDFQNVNFKRCDFSRTTAIGCKYESMRRVKLIWSKLERTAKVAYQSLNKFKFTEEDYRVLLDLYSKKSSSATVSDIACKWMKQKKGSWERWIPFSNTGKSEIYIGGIFPRTGLSPTAGKEILESVSMALQTINDDQSILSDYHLVILIANGQCKTDTVLKVFIDYIVENYFNSLIGILGPGCSETLESLAGIAKHYKTLIVSYNAEGTNFSDRKKYPYVFRTIGDNKHYKHAYLQLFKELGWNRVAALTQDGPKYTEYVSEMEDLLRQQGISFITNIKFLRGRNVGVITRYLAELKVKGARIIIADVYDDVARALICEAYKLGMTTKEGYVWFLPHWLNSTWYNVTNYNEDVDCTTEDIIETINGYFAVSPAFFAPNDTITHGNITVGEWRELYDYKVATSSMISNYAGFLHDAVWTYALAIDKLIKEDPTALSRLHSENTTNKLANLIKTTDFTGVSGRIKFYGGSSRISVIHVLQWFNNNTRIVGYFHPNISDESGEVFGGVLKLNTSLIAWLTPNGEKPDDGYVSSNLDVPYGSGEFHITECEVIGKAHCQCLFNNSIRHFNLHNSTLADTVMPSL